jgi:hypothetical protein
MAEVLLQAASSNNGQQTRRKGFMKGFLSMTTFLSGPSLFAVSFRVSIGNVFIGEVQLQIVHLQQFLVCITTGPERIENRDIRGIYPL